MLKEDIQHIYQRHGIGPLLLVGLTRSPLLIIGLYDSSWCGFMVYG